MRFSITLDKDKLYLSYLQTMNGLFKLSSKEMDILSEFMLLKDRLTSGNIIGDDLNSLLFSPSSRKIIYTKLGISQFNLNNYIASLRSKRMILHSEGLFMLNPKYTTLNIVNNTYELSFNFTINGNSIQSNTHEL